MMAVIRTDIRNLREAARRIRFEQVPGINETDVQNAIEHVAGLAINTSILELVTAAGTVNVGADEPGFDITSSVAGTVDFDLPASASRDGKPIVIVDGGGVLFTYNATLTPQPGETIRGMNPYTIAGNYGLYVLYPRKDNIGYHLGEQ